MYGVKTELVKAWSGFSWLRIRAAWRYVIGLCVLVIHNRREIVNELNDYQL
jgi:hypothetical protein